MSRWARAYFLAMAFLSLGLSAQSIILGRGELQALRTVHAFYPRLQQFERISAVGKELLFGGEAKDLGQVLVTEEGLWSGRGIRSVVLSPPRRGASSDSLCIREVLAASGGSSFGSAGGTAIPGKAIQQLVTDSITWGNNPSSPIQMTLETYRTLSGGIEDGEALGGYLAQLNEATKALLSKQLSGEEKGRFLETLRSGEERLAQSFPATLGEGLPLLDATGTEFLSAALAENSTPIKLQRLQGGQYRAIVPIAPLSNLLLTGDSSLSALREGNLVPKLLDEAWLEKNGVELLVVDEEGAYRVNPRLLAPGLPFLP